MLRQRNLSGLQDELDHWAHDAAHTESRIPATTGLPPASLATLLRAAARPSPLRSNHHPRPIHGLAVSGDGQTAVSVDASGNVTQWNLTAADAPPRTLGTHGEQADAVAISPAGNQAVTGSKLDTLKSWDLNSGRLLRTIQPLTNGVESLRWSPDGNHVAAGARYDGVWVGDCEGTQRPQPTYFFADHVRASEHAKQFNGGVCFPNGTVSFDIVGGLIALVDHGHIDIADCRSGEVLGQIESPSTSWHVASFSTDGGRMVAYNFDKLCIWQSDDRWATHTLVRSIELPQHNPPTLTDQGQTVIVDAKQHDCLIEIDVASGEEKTRYPGPSDSDYCVSHDASLLAETTHQGIRVRNRETGKLVLERSVDSQPRKIQFVADDRVLLLLNNDGSLTAWHIPTRQTLGPLFAPEHLLGVPIHLQIAASGRRVIMNYQSPENRLPVVLGRP